MLGHQKPEKIANAEVVAETPVRRALVDSHLVLLGYLRRRFGNREEAAEVLQVFVMRALERETALRDAESVRGWLGRVLATTIVDHQRRAISRRGREAVLEPQHLDSVAVEADSEGDQAVCACLHALLPSLRPDDADLIRRADLMGEAREVIATSLGITANALGVRMHRARRALKARLEAMCLTCPVHGFLDCECEHARRIQALRSDASDTRAALPRLSVSP